MPNGLSETLAKRFLMKIDKYTEYNVNIIDVNGIIIAASRMKERIGKFHEMAYYMIQNHVESMVIQSENDYDGVLPGVNLLLQSSGSVLSVVGVTGEVEKVREIAMIIKMSLETVIGYEKQQEDILYRRSVQEQFYIALFVQAPPSKTTLELLARQLQIEEHCIRIPVLLCFKETTPKDVTSLRREIPILREQDLCWIFDNHRALVFFKIGSEGEDVLRNWRRIVCAWLERLQRYKRFDVAYVGSIQNRLIYYASALKHCRWLEENVVGSRNQANAYFFYDYVQEYAASLVPDIELHAAFNVFRRILDEPMKELFVQTVSALESNNYHLSESSKQLYLHKNTMAFRMNRIKERMDIDPLHEAKDRKMAMWLCQYFGNDKPTG